MSFILWLIVAGGLFIVTALVGSFLKRLPLTAPLLYLAVGFGLGPAGMGLFHLDPLEQVGFLERITEVAVLISLFSAGLKLRMPLSEGRWFLPVRLAFLSMTLTVGLITAVGVLGFSLPLGACILLGAILAPTDPVLASDVQVENPEDRDLLRFSLTGEAGLNDGTAFPFVMLGLGLLGLHEIGVGGYRWLAVDVVWAIVGGIGIGSLLGTLVGHTVLYLRREHQEAVGRDDFLALGLVTLSYGSALLAQTYGFLAVFTAGLALRRVERWHTGEKPPQPVRVAAEAGQTEKVATAPETAPAYMAQAILSFNEQLERSAEMVVVVLLGAMLSTVPLATPALWFAPFLFLIIRPAAVWLGLLGSQISRVQCNLIAWFGMRGIGSIYYLMYALRHNLPDDLARQLIVLTLATVATSIVAHGMTATPLMDYYQRRLGRPVLGGSKTR